MKIISDSIHYTPVWVHAHKLELYWRREESLYLEKWVGPPRDFWFQMGVAEKRKAFRAGLACLDTSRYGEHVIGFTNGRHRTRWLLSRGLTEIPICIPWEQIYEWKNLGLTTEFPRPMLLNRRRLGFGLYADGLHRVNSYESEGTDDITQWD